MSGCCFMRAFLFFVSILCGFSAGAEYHLGIQANGSYNTVWNFYDKVSIKKDAISKRTEKPLFKDSKQRYFTEGENVDGFGWSIGAAFSKPVTSHLKLHSHLLLGFRSLGVNTELFREDSLETQQKNISEGKHDFGIKYWNLDLPIFARVPLPGKTFIDAGLKVSYILKADLKLDILMMDVKTYAPGFNLGTLLQAGKTLTIKGHPIDLQFAFILGLTPILNDDVKDYVTKDLNPKDWILQLGLSYWIF